MNQRINKFSSLHLTKGESDSPLQMKPQPFSKKHEISSQFLFKEGNQNLKNSTLNHESQVFGEQEDSNASDVSFEDDILQRHETALNQQLQKSKGLFMQNSCHQQRPTIFKIGSFFDTLYKVLMPGAISNCSLVQTFHYYLQQHSTLHQFLAHIHFSYNEKISNKLLQLSFMIWSLYRRQLGKINNQAEIYIFTNDIAQKVSSRQNIFKKFKNQTLFIQKQQMRKNFILFFTNTIILVIQGFFKNAYSETRYLSKAQKANQLVQQNQQSCQFGLYGRKQMKIAPL